MNNLKFTFLIVSLSACITVHSQSVLTTSHNKVLTYDRLELHLVETPDLLNPVGGSFFVDLTGAEIAKKPSVKRYSSVIAPDTITSVLKGNRHYFVERADTILLVGEENHQKRITYDIPEHWLRFPFNLGDSLCGSYHGTGEYCGKLFVRKYGAYKTKAEALGSIILPEGDTLRNVLLVHSRRSIAVQTMPKDSMKLRLSPFTTDSLRQHLFSDTIWTYCDIQRYYANGYRYPILETFTTTGDAVSDAETYTYYFAPFIQEQLDMDEENMIVRRNMAKDKDQSSNDGMEGEWHEREKDAGIKYSLAHNSEGHYVQLSYELSRPTDVKLLLCNVQGVVLRSAIQHGNIGKNKLLLDYGNLKPGRYVFYIEADGRKFTEKFVVG